MVRKKCFLDEIYKQKIILNIFKTSYTKQDFYEMFAARRILNFFLFHNDLLTSYTTYILVLISFVGTNISARESWMWEKDRVPVENSLVKEGDHFRLSHTTTVDHGDRTRIAAVISECLVYDRSIRYFPTTNNGLIYQ